MMAINYTGQDSERFAEFFDGEAPGGRSNRWRGADVCVAPIVYTDTHSIHRDIANMKARDGAAGVEEGFLPVVAPASAAFNGVNDYYKTDEEYVYALSEALRTEYLRDLRSRPASCRSTTPCWPTPTTTSWRAARRTTASGRRCASRR